MTTHACLMKADALHGTPCTAATTTTARLRRTLSGWTERARRRHELRELLDAPEYLLKDMGVTREAVYRESRKPFWRK